MRAAAMQLVCIDCGETWPTAEPRYLCECGGTLDVAHDLDALRGALSLEMFEARRGARDPVDRSGVWRFRELILPVDANDVVTRGEGNTTLFATPPSI